jgi:hypothetical protein
MVALNPQPFPPSPSSSVALNPQPFPPAPGEWVGLNPQPFPPSPYAPDAIALNPQPFPPGPTTTMSYSGGLFMHEIGRAIALGHDDSDRLCGTWENDGWVDNDCNGVVSDGGTTFRVTGKLRPAFRPAPSKLPNPSEYSLLRRGKIKIDAAFGGGPPDVDPPISPDEDDAYGPLSYGASMLCWWCPN